MKKTILSAEESYSFDDYFKLIAYVKDLLKYFAYVFRRWHWFVVADRD